jgi:hypothetical protein
MALLFVISPAHRSVQHRSGEASSASFGGHLLAARRIDTAFVDMTIVIRVTVPVMFVIDMTFVLNRAVTAVFAVLMRMAVVNVVLAHRMPPAETVEHKVSRKRHSQGCG